MARKVTNALGISAERDLRDVERAATRGQGAVEPGDDDVVHLRRIVRGRGSRLRRRRRLRVGGSCADDGDRQRQMQAIGMAPQFGNQAYLDADRLMGAGQTLQDQQQQGRTL